MMAVRHHLVWLSKDINLEYLAMLVHEIFQEDKDVELGKFQSPSKDQYKEKPIKIIACCQATGITARLSFSELDTLMKVKGFNIPSRFTIN